MGWLSIRLPAVWLGFRTTCRLAGTSPWRGSKEERERLSPATSMGPLFGVFCHEHAGKRQTASAPDRASGGASRREVTRMQAAAERPAPCHKARPPRRLAEIPQAAPAARAADRGLKARLVRLVARQDSRHVVRRQVRVPTNAVDGPRAGPADVVSDRVVNVVSDRIAPAVGRQKVSVADHHRPAVAEHVHMPGVVGAVRRAWSRAGPAMADAIRRASPGHGINHVTRQVTRPPGGPRWRAG